LSRPRAAVPRAGVALLAAGLGVAGCGKRGDPLPPLSRAPQNVTELRLAQRGPRLEVSFVAPRTSAGGLRLGVLEVELLQAEGAGDFGKLAHKTFRKMAPGESFADTVPLPAVGTVVRAAAKVKSAGETSAQTPVVTLTVQAPPAAPTAFTAQLEPQAVVLAWVPPPTPPPTPSPSASPEGSPTPSASPTDAPSPAISPTPEVTPSPAVSPSPTVAPSAAPSGPPGPSPSPGVSPSPGAPSSPSASPSPSPTPKPQSGFWIYRREPESTYRRPLMPVPVAAPPYLDTTVAAGERWCYVVRTVASTEPVVESASSGEACVENKDVFPPAAPTGVAALVHDDGVEVSWSPSLESDLASYRVYRAVAGAPPVRLAMVTAPETSFRDTTGPHGTALAYTVTAVDRDGNESPPSTAVEARRP
jgi:hypothetical protein